jgi:hypothetical protein
MKFESFYTKEDADVEEAIDLTRAKEYTRLGHKNRENTQEHVKEQMAIAFKGADRNGRIIIPFDTTETVDDPVSYGTTYKAALETVGNLVRALRDQFADKPEIKFQIAFPANAEVEDLLGGAIEVNGKTDTAKLFLRKQKVQASPEVLKAMTALGDLKKPTMSNYVIVISHHPYDVAGMSTNRQWPSCKDLNGGQYNKFLHGEVGRLGVAYLSKVTPKGVGVVVGDRKVTSKDPVGDPLMRILILPYVDQDDGELCYYYTNVPNERVHKNLVYGGSNAMTQKQFVNQVQKVLVDNQGEVPEEGNWELPSNFYDDIHGPGPGRGKSIDAPGYSSNKGVTKEQMKSLATGIVDSMEPRRSDWTDEQYDEAIDITYVGLREEMENYEEATSGGTISFDDLEQYAQEWYWYVDDTVDALEEKFGVDSKDVGNRLAIMSQCYSYRESLRSDIENDSQYSDWTPEDLERYGFTYKGVEPVIEQILNRRKRFMDNNETSRMNGWRDRDASGASAHGFIFSDDDVDLIRNALKSSYDNYKNVDLYELVVSELEDKEKWLTPEYKKLIKDMVDGLEHSKKETRKENPQTKLQLDHKKHTHSLIECVNRFMEYEGD